MELILHWILQYKYFGIFGLLALGVIGLPIPDESTLMFLGVMVSQHKLGLAPTLLAAFLGSAGGITVSFFFGHTFGLYVVHRFGHWFGLTPERLERAHRWFARAGKWSLTFGYYIPGVRHLTALVAGATKLEYPLFALFAYTGALLWAVTFILLGSFLGEGWKLLARFGIQMAADAAVIVIAAAVYLFFRWRQRAGRSQPPAKEKHA
jgi:membrane protein DedA with SNARE-associated domain